MSLTATLCLDKTATVHRALSRQNAARLTCATAELNLIRKDRDADRRGRHRHRAPAPLPRPARHSAKMGSGLHHRPRAHGSGHTPPEIRNRQWSAVSGTVTLNWGQWTAQASPGTLTLRAEAADAENLQNIQDMLSTRLENFGKRENLTVTWQRGETPAVEPGQAG
jgi:hypothetical protein